MRKKVKQKTELGERQKALLQYLNGLFMGSNLFSEFGIYEDPGSQTIYLFAKPIIVFRDMLKKSDDPADFLYKSPLPLEADLAGSEVNKKASEILRGFFLLYLKGGRKEAHINKETVQ